MNKQSVNQLFIVFVLTTMFVVTIAGGVIVLARLQGIRLQAEHEAADVSNRALIPPLAQAAGTGGLDTQSFRRNAQGLIGPTVLSIRFWDAQGNLLATAGDEQAPPPARSAIAAAGLGDATESRITTHGAARLDSYQAFIPGVVVEVQQDYAPVEASITSMRNDLILLLALVGGGLALILPLILWVALRGLRREYNRLLYLYQTGQAIRSTLDLTDVLEQTAYDAAVFTRASIGIGVVVEEGTNDLIVTASYDRPGDVRSQHHRKADDWHLRRSAATGETVVAAEATLSYGTLLGFDPTIRGPVNVVSVAIRGRERSVALLMIIREAVFGPFKPAEIQMLEEMAAQAAMSVEQAVLFNKLRAYAVEIEVGYDSTLKVLSAALDTKDQNTHGHSERVAKLTLSLAREMGVPNERLVDMERGALLHDVGKIGVPDHVLLKPTTLNDREWEAMQKHPLLAGLMVSKVGFLEGALPILLYHHERYDGSGYPFGLQGHAIPLEARIFTIVDAFDAMTSDRPYRQAMPVETAMAEIRANAGIQFDPEVVEAFTRVIDRLHPFEQEHHHSEDEAPAEAA